jgi:hypothetical protein
MIGDRATVRNGLDRGAYEALAGEFDLAPSKAAGDSSVAPQQDAGGMAAARVLEHLGGSPSRTSANAR